MLIISSNHYYQLYRTAYFTLIWDRMAQPVLTGGKQTILIADREFPIRVGLLTILSGEPGLLVPAPASTIKELTALASQHRGALILMDTTFSDGDGIEACRALLSRHTGLRVLFFTNSATPRTAMQAIDAGATGFFTKSVAQGELLAGIRRMLAGQSAFDPALMSATIKWIREQHHSTGMTLPQLSPRHQEILPLLSEGLTNKEISTRLSLSEKTIKNYLADLFDRLHMSRRAQVAAWFISQNLRQPPSQNTSGIVQHAWSKPRIHAQGKEEPLHAHHSPY